VETSSSNKDHTGTEAALPRKPADSKEKKRRGETRGMRKEEFKER